MLQSICLTENKQKRNLCQKGGLEQTKRSNKPNANQSRCTQRIVAQTNRRSSADQWQCIQKELRRPTADQAQTNGSVHAGHWRRPTTDQAQTKRRPMAMYTKGSGADQPQTKRRPSADQWCYGAIGLVSFQKPFVTGASFEASQSSHKTIRGAASINLTLIIKNSTTR